MELGPLRNHPLTVSRQSTQPAQPSPARLLHDKFLRPGWLTAAGQARSPPPIRSEDGVAAAVIGRTPGGGMVGGGGWQQLRRNHQLLISRRGVRTIPAILSDTR